MRLVVLDYRSSPAVPNNLLDVYVRMPGGIPGVTLNASSTQYNISPWKYTLKLGNGSPVQCSVDTNYPDRLYCAVLPGASQEGSTQNFQLFVDGCSSPVMTLSEQIPSRTSGGQSALGSSCPSGEEYHASTGDGWWDGGCCTIGCWCEIAGATGCFNNCSGCNP
jgi:hypothetical protein